MSFFRTNPFKIIIFLLICSTFFISGGKNLSLLPPVLAIGLAFLTKQVLISLFCGIWSGAVIVLYNGGNPFVLSFLKGFFKAADTYAVKGLNDESHIMIVIFSLLIGGMVGIITASGGMHGVVNVLSEKTNSKEKSLIFSWAAGLFIFFDDYANTLIVGNSMRPLTDKYKVSPEKLSFIIDSTTAPVASIAVLSTWIGYEVGLIGEALKNSQLQLDPYWVFIQSLPYRFYALLLLIFIPVYIFMKRDFGPMLKAEKNCLEGKKNEGEEGDTALEGFKIPDISKCRWYSAAIPVAVLIIATFSGIIISGYINSIGSADSIVPDPSFREIVGSADSFKVLIWSSMIASVTAAVTMIISGTGNISSAVSAWLAGMRSMVTAIVILVLAWGLSAVVNELKTAEFLAVVLSDTIPVWLFPSIVFITASAVSFATGTSWGTMALLFPTALPLAITMIGATAGLSETFIFSITGAILTGAIFGDHCSPVSDTTIMASMSCRVNHIDHVRTQMPYALTFGIISILFGYLPAGFFVNPFLLIIPQIAAAFLIFRYFGKKQDIK